MANYKDELQKHLRKESLHHTYIVVGERSDIKKEVVGYLRDAFELPHSYPDIWIKEYESVGVKDVEEIAAVHIRKPIGSNKKFIIFDTSQITLQAQNSLLKMLEEPTAETHFFIIMPTVATLLPTILSRAHVITLEQAAESALEDAKKEDDSEDDVSQSIIAKFVSMSAAERIVVVADLLADYDKEKIKREDVCSFVSDVEMYIHSHLIKKSSIKDKEESFKVLVQVQEYMRDTSSSLKLLLEYLALSLPRL